MFDTQVCCKTAIWPCGGALVREGPQIKQSQGQRTWCKPKASKLPNNSAGGLRRRRDINGRARRPAVPRRDELELERRVADSELLADHDLPRSPFRARYNLHRASNHIRSVLNRRTITIRQKCIRRVYSEPSRQAERSLGALLSPSRVPLPAQEPST